jgi:hypothetical protein
MERGAKIFIISLGAVYLISILIFLFSLSGCSRICEIFQLGIICGCTSNEIILLVITLGLPSWILFLLVAMFKDN